MEIFGQIASRIDVFLLIAARIGGIFLVGPIYSNKMIPKQVKAFLTLIVSLIMFTSLQVNPPVMPSELFPFAMYLASEMAIGLVIGFAAQFTFAAIQFAGQAMDLQMGFAIVNVMDPVYGTQAPLIGSFQNLLAILVFLVTNSHHYMIAALYQSYQQIPLFGLTGGTEISRLMIDLFGSMLVTGLKLAIPVVGAIFVAEVALGLIARTMPQMQIFFIGIPVKIFVGLVLLIIIMPVYVTSVQFLFDADYREMLKLIKIMGSKGQ